MVYDSTNETDCDLSDDEMILITIKDQKAIVISLAGMDYFSCRFVSYLTNFFVT